MLEQFLETELLVNVTQHEVKFKTYLLACL